MNTKILIEILLEIRSSSKLLSQDLTDENLKALIHKYNMLFVGENFNCIYSLELANSIRTFFNVEVSNDALNSLIPEVCTLLNMQYEPLVSLGDTANSNPEISCYSIILW